MPSHVICLSLSAEITSASFGSSVHQFNLKRWSAVHRSRYRGRNDRTATATGTTAAEWWMFLQSVATGTRRPWIIAPDAANAFRALDGWTYSDSGLIDWGELAKLPTKSKGAKPKQPKRASCSMVLSESCTILTHNLGPSRVTWVSVTNYLPFDATAFAQAVDIPIPYLLEYGPGGQVFQHDPHLTARILDEYFARMMARYLADGGGHWRPTAAQLAHQTWRRSYYTEPVLEHDNQALASLEREGIVGGRADVNFYGTVGDAPGSVKGEESGPEPVHPAVLDGPLIQLDVRSQYPAILRSERFPVAFDRFITGCTIKRLAALCRTSCVLARVELDTPEPAYPFVTGGQLSVRHGGKSERFGRNQTRSEKVTIFPTGTFWTVLYGPELQHAIERDRVRRVGVVASYQAGHPFAEYAASMIDARNEARAERDPTRESLYKLLANSFAGKFAARPGGWRTVRGKVWPNPWDQWNAINQETGEVESWRSISGVCQVFVPVDDKPSGCPSVFGYLTSYGRLQLWDMMQQAGPRGWVWCHTDGIVLTRTGETSAQRTIRRNSGKPGEWRVVGPVSRARCWGPAHYFADGSWVLSGWTDGVWVDTRGTVYDWRRNTVGEMIAAEGSPSVRMTLRASLLEASRAQSRVGPDGWALTPEVRNGERVAAYADDSFR